MKAQNQIEKCEQQIEHLKDMLEEEDYKVKQLRSEQQHLSLSQIQEKTEQNKRL